MFLKEINFSRDKFLRFARIFGKFAKLKKSSWKVHRFFKSTFFFIVFYFRFSELAKLAFLHEVLYQLTIVN